MSSKIKSQYICQSCGYISPRWVGKCPECEGWNTFVEEIISTEKKQKEKKDDLKASSVEIHTIKTIESRNELRVQTKIQEFDRVLGGGLVSGSVILIGGDPGIGKSTLMLQIAENLTDKKIPLCNWGRITTTNKNESK